MTSAPAVSMPKLTEEGCRLPLRDEPITYAEQHERGKLEMRYGTRLALPREAVLVLTILDVSMTRRVIVRSRNATP